MKKTIVTLACALIAPLAFAQTSSKGTRQGTTTAETITITGTMVTETSEEGAAASYQPGRYVLNGSGHIVNKKGEVVRTAIKAGARVRVYYVNTGGSRVVDHVVVEE